MTTFQKLFILALYVCSVFASHSSDKTESVSRKSVSSESDDETTYEPMESTYNTYDITTTDEVATTEYIPEEEATITTEDNQIDTTESPDTTQYRSNDSSDPDSNNNNNNKHDGSTDSVILTTQSSDSSDVMVSTTPNELYTTFDLEATTRDSNDNDEERNQSNESSESAISTTEDINDSTTQTRIQTTVENGDSDYGIISTTQQFDTANGSQDSQDISLSTTQDSDENSFSTIQTTRDDESDDDEQESDDNDSDIDSENSDSADDVTMTTTNDVTDNQTSTTNSIDTTENRDYINTTIGEDVYPTTNSGTIETTLDYNCSGDIASRHCACFDEVICSGSQEMNIDCYWDEPSNKCKATSMMQISEEISSETTNKKVIFGVGFGVVAFILIIFVLGGWWYCKKQKSSHKVGAQRLPMNDESGDDMTDIEEGATTKNSDQVPDFSDSDSALPMNASTENGELQEIEENEEMQVLVGSDGISALN